VEAKLADAIPASQGRAGRLRTILDWWQWIPLPLAAVYLLVVLVKFNELIASTYLNADSASAPVIGELFGGSPAHRQVILGNMGWYSTLMFELATRWLPAHRQIWEAAPYALALASAVLIAWGASRVAGRRGAMVAGVLVLCAGPRTLDWLFALDDHSPTWFSLTLLGALLMALLVRPAWLGNGLLALCVALTGAVVGANTASDPLLVVGGAVPFLLAGASAWALSPDAKRARAAAWALACMMVAGVCDLLTHALMKHENVILPQGDVRNVLASGEAVASNFKLWWQSLTVLGNGGFYGEQLSFSSGLRLTCAVMTLAAVAWIGPILWRELSLALDRTDPDVSAARGAWCVFWAASAVLISASFIFSTNPMDIFSSRYLVGVIYAVAAMMAVLMTREILVRAAVTGATAVFALTGIVSLWQGQATTNTGNFPTGYAYGLVAKIAKREHLTTGYAGYWDAAPITWGTHLQVKVYPVQQCDGENLCEYGLHNITSWYVPHAHERTFLIFDPTQPVRTPALPVLGKPSAVYKIAELTLYVYPYDIAGRFQP
jgi:hypothetical protein